MRVLFFIAALDAGGAERAVSRLANAWVERGWEVVVVTLAAAGADFFPLSPAIQRVGLDALADSAHVFEALARNVRRLAKLRNTVAERRPDVVIGFCDRANILALVATWGLGVKVIVSERTDPAQHAIGEFWSWARRRVYPRASAVVVQTEAVKRWLEREIPAARTVAIPNPVWRAALPPAARREGDSLEVVGVGRLGYEKGFDLLLNAFGLVAERFPDWRLRIVGDGDRRGELEALAARLGLAGRVAFTGKVPNPEDYMHRAALFALPSRYEGFPNALLEAMACGLPAVSFDCPSGPAAIIRHGLDGLLVPAEDVPAFSAALAELMADAGKREFLGGNARAVLDRFGPENILGQWEALMTEVTV